MRHLPIWLVVIPLFQGFLIPFIRVFEEHWQHERTTKLFPSVKGLLGVLLGIETIITVILLIFYHAPWIYSVGGWQAPFGVPIFIDRLSLIFLCLINLGMVVVTVYSFSYPIQQEIKYYTLLCTIRAAMVGLVLSADIFNMYILIELISIASTALITLRLGSRSIWGGFQYLIINSLAGLLIFLGIILLYGTYGVLSLSGIASALQGTSALLPRTIWAMGLIMVGGLIKVALFPFHYWLPPAHGEAELPVSALLSGVLLQVNFYFLFRLFTSVFPLDSFLGQMLQILSILSIIVGHGGALFAKNAKQILAYSGVVHMGYTGLAFGLAGPNQYLAVVFLLLQHFVGKLFAFLGLGVVRSTDKTLSFKEASLRAGFILALLSLAGLPPFPGFWGKWFLLQESSSVGPSWAAWIVILSVYPGVIYYHRVYRLAIDNKTENKKTDLQQGIGWGAGFTLGLAFPAVLGLTMFFAWVILNQGQGLSVSFGKTFLELVVALAVLALYTRTEKIKREKGRNISTKPSGFVFDRLNITRIGFSFCPFKATLWVIFITVMILLYCRY